MQDGSDPEHNGRAEPLRAMGAEPLRGVGDEPLRAMEDEPLREKDADPTWAWRFSGVLLSGAISWVAIGMIRSYQIFISPLLGPNCRFTPTCSAYAIGAIQKHGLLRGGWGAIKRVCRCHPWNPGGYDPP